MSEPGAVADAARASDVALHASTLAVLAVLVATGLDPLDRGTWWLEVIPVVGVLAALWATRRRFPLTPVLHGGDPWDAHWDMLCALLGATAALVLLGRVHNGSLAALGVPPPR